MGLETETIRYNLNDRGRKYVGQPRYFNVQKFAALVNGARIQEMVQSRDLVGYLGHDVRRMFGIKPPESVIDGGQFVPIEPAFVTTYIHVDDDGTVEHRARFLDTPLGKKAQEWFVAKTGGFSSVVTPDERNPSDFHGFDYVLNPNFSSNRGYVLDSVDYNRMTSKQKAVYEQGLRLEQQAVMDALYQTACAVPELLATNRQLAASVDCMAAQLDDACFQAALNETQPETFAPMVRLSAGDNWLQQSLSAMDDIRQTVAPKPIRRADDILAFLEGRP